MQTSTSNVSSDKASFFARAFGNDEVPRDMRALSEWFCTHFDVNGVCDPMYIANVTAFELQIGDGCGNFTGDGPKGGQDAFERVARRLLFAYSTCVHLTHPETTPHLLAQQLMTAVRAGRDD